MTDIDSAIKKLKEEFEGNYLTCYAAVSVHEAIDRTVAICRVHQFRLHALIQNMNNSYNPGSDPFDIEAALAAMSCRADPPGAPGQNEECCAHVNSAPDEASAGMSPVEEPDEVADDELITCEPCGKRVPLDESEDVYSDTGPICYECAEAQRQEVAKCDHLWEPGVTDYGIGMVCTRCLCFVRHEPAAAPPSSVITVTKQECGALLRMISGRSATIDTVALALQKVLPGRVRIAS